MPGNSTIMPQPVSYMCHWHREGTLKRFDLVRVMKVTRRPYKGKVYNLHVEEDNTYVANNVIVHNCYGTISHRLVAQAVVGMPLTLYGKGHQRRGFIPLRDAIQCFTLLIENPPPQGSYRVVNQLENRYDISDVAAKVVEVASEFGISASAGHVPNPRVEIEDNYWYHPTHEKLKELGYKPSTTLEEEIRRLFEVVIRFKNRITKEVLVPRIRWR